MADVSHFVGSDTGFGPTGDFAIVSGWQLTQQRVLRRLLTNLRDYLWHPEYGCGLPQEVGRLYQERKLIGIVRTQMFLESSVARTPDPVITVSMGIPGVVTVDIVYQDQATGQSVPLTFSINQ